MRYDFRRKRDKLAVLVAIFVIIFVCYNHVNCSPERPACSLLDKFILMVLR